MIQASTIASFRRALRGLAADASRYLGLGCTPDDLARMLDELADLHRDFIELGGPRDRA